MITLPPFFQKYNNVFLEKGAKHQPLLKDAKYKIKLLPRTKPLHGLIYPLFVKYLETL